VFRTLVSPTQGGMFQCWLFSDDAVSFEKSPLTRHAKCLANLLRREPLTLPSWGRAGAKSNSSIGFD
jgi:hypothetical protein